jgi:hypothetical protein
MLFLAFASFANTLASYHIGSNPLDWGVRHASSNITFLSLSTKASTWHTPCIGVFFIIFTFCQ